MSCTSRRQAGAKKSETCRPMAFCFPGDSPFSWLYPKFMNTVSLDIMFLHFFAFSTIHRYPQLRWMQICRKQIEHKHHDQVHMRRTSKASESVKLKPERLEVTVPWQHHTAQCPVDLSGCATASEIDAAEWRWPTLARAPARDHQRRKAAAVIDCASKIRELRYFPNPSKWFQHVSTSVHNYHNCTHNIIINYILLYNRCIINLHINSYSIHMITKYIKYADINEWYYVVIWVINPPTPFGQAMEMQLPVEFLSCHGGTVNDTIFRETMKISWSRTIMYQQLFSCATKIFRLKTQLLVREVVEFPVIFYFYMFLLYCR